MTKETSHPFYRSRRGKPLNNFNLNVIHFDAPSRNNMTQYYLLLYHEMEIFLIQNKVNFFAAMEYLG